MLKWERVDQLHRRAPIKGGWLVRGVTVEGDHIALCFVPDAMHAWKLEDEDG